MRKGMVSAIIGLMVIGLIALSFTYLKPVKLQEELEPQYQFIEKTEQKKILLRYLSDQAITEALGDYVKAREEIEAPGASCDNNVTVTLQEIDSNITRYLETVNTLPENIGCTVSIETSSIDRTITPILHTSEIAITCSTEKRNEAGIPEILFEIKKFYPSQKKTEIPPSQANPDCNVVVRDLQSETEWKN